MRAIKSVSSERGRDPRKFSLHAFGGAGPVPAAGVAKGLGMNCIVIPPAPGVFSAFGLLTGNIERHFSRSFSRPWDKLSLAEANSIIDDLESEARSTMSFWAGKDWDNELSINRLLDLQYDGQGSSLSIAFRENLNSPTSVEKIAAFVALSVNNSPTENVPSVSNVSNKTVDVFAEDLIVEVLFAKSKRVSDAENVPTTFVTSIHT